MIRRQPRLDALPRPQCGGIDLGIRATKVHLAASILAGEMMGHKGPSVVFPIDDEPSLKSDDRCIAYRGPDDLDGCEDRRGRLGILSHPSMGAQSPPRSMPGCSYLTT